MNKKECPDCDGSGLSCFDCQCHVGGMATIECSPCLTCCGKGSITDSILLTPEQVEGIYKSNYRSELEFYQALNKEQAQEIYKWGEDVCREHSNPCTLEFRRRFDCPRCMDKFKEELEGK